MITIFGLEKHTWPPTAATCLAAALAAGGAACSTTHQLGETADESGGSGDGTGTTTAATTTAASQTSTTAASEGTTAADTSTADSGTSAESDGDSTGAPVECMESLLLLRWRVDSLDPLDGLEAGSTVAVGGPCTVSDRIEQLGPENQVQLEFPLDCVLGGQIDGDDVVDVPMQPTFRATVVGADPGLQIGQQIELRLAARWWGMGWDRWLVLRQPDEITIVDAIAASWIDPAESFIADTVVEVFGPEPWHGDLELGVETSECPVDLQCFTDSMAVLASWTGEPGVSLASKQYGGITTPVPMLGYGVYVSSARAGSEPVCDDVPLADYAVATWAQWK